MFTVIALQSSISAGYIGILGVFLALGAGGYVCTHAIRRFLSPSRRFAGRPGRIAIRAENNLTLDAAARRLFGASNRDITSLASLAGLVANQGDGSDATAKKRTFAEDLTALINTGAGFESLLRTLSGDLIAATGQPAGSHTIVRVRPATAHETALSAELAHRLECETQIEMLEATIKASGASAVCLDGDGQPLWRSATFETLPVDAQDAILSRATGDDQAAAQGPIATAGTTDAPLHLNLTIAKLSDERVLGAATDVTKQVAAEQGFRQFVSTMSDTFAHLKISLMIFDADRRLTLFNPATVDMIRMDAVWLAQRPTLKVLLDRLREARMTPEQPNFIEWRDRLLQTTAPHKKGEPRAAVKQEDVWHLANGRTLLVLARPHPSGGLAVIIEDISDAMALKRQSISERAVHLATTDVLEEALILFAPDGTARSSNASFRSLWAINSDTKVSDQHVKDIANHCRRYAPDNGFWHDLVNSVTGERQRGAFTTRLLHNNGTILMARISPVPDGSVLAVFSDITDSERIAAALTERNDALEQAQEMRVALIDQISHQMRNPLNSIFGFEQMLTQGHVGALTEQQQSYVKGIATASQELLSAIDGMTEIIDLDEDTNTAAGGLVSVTHILTDVAAIVNRRNEVDIVRVKPARTPLTPPPDDGAAQRGHLRQIIFNMITDTLSSTAQSGEQSNDDETAVAETSVGVADDLLVITCRRKSDVQQPAPTLAFAMASRLARILDGSVRLDEEEGWRTLSCRLPLEVVIEAQAQTTPTEQPAALAPPSAKASTTTQPAPPDPNRSHARDDAPLDHR